VDEEVVRVIQSSWNQLLGKEEAVVIRFYERLFIEHPEYRPLFTHSKKVQRAKFLSMLNIIINGLDNLEFLSDPLKNLGKKHGGMGLINEDYENVAAALVNAIDEVSDKPLSDIERRSWFEGLMTVSKVMMKASNPC